jgi:hypothetical protein
MDNHEPIAETAHTNLNRCSHCGSVTLECYDGEDRLITVIEMNGEDWLEMCKSIAQAHTDPEAWDLGRERQDAGGVQ